MAGSIERSHPDSKATLALQQAETQSVPPIVSPVSDLNDAPSSSRGHDTSPAEGPAVTPPVAVSAAHLSSRGSSHPYWQDLSDWLAAAYRPSMAQVDTAFAVLRSRSEIEGCVGAIPLELIRGM